MDKNFKVILIDDAFCKNAYADVVFNGTMINQYHKYNKIKRNSKLYLGSKYFVVSHDFQKYKKNLLEIHTKKKYHVVISMGGSDPTHLSLFVLRSIRNLKNIKITVIIGPFFTDVKKIKSVAKGNKSIIVKFCPKEIWKEFHDADVVISKSGITLYELAILRIPTICISGFEHEEPNANAFASKGVIINIGKQKYVTSNRIREVLLEVLKNTNTRRKIFFSAKRIIDSKGLFRVTTILEKILKNIYI